VRHAFRRAVLIASLGISGVSYAAPLTGDPDFFPIGVWYQPTSNFDLWKNAGVNTLIGYEGEGGNVSIDAWSAAAVSKNLFMIRQARPYAAADANQKNLIGFLQADEPDKAGNLQGLQTEFARVKQAVPSMPVWLNFSGGNVLGGNPTAAEYRNYAQYGDVITNDLYTVTGWNLADHLDHSKPLAAPFTQRWTPGTAASTLQQITGKPQAAFIETSKQNLPWVPNERGVTAPELRGEVWDAIIQGAAGIFYFPDTFGVGWPAGFNGTPADVMAELTKQNQRITSLASVLNTPRDPASLKFSTGSPLLQATWRHTDQGDFFVVENMSSQTLTGAGFDISGLTNGAITVVGEDRQLPSSPAGLESDNFAAYETHVYEVSLAVPQNPDPAGIAGIGAMTTLLLWRRRRPQKQ
jgi:hypothetical protein